MSPTAGAVGSTSAPGTEFTCTKNAGTAGKYDLTFPPCVAIDLYFMIVSPASTVSTVIVTAVDAGAGTAAILCADSGIEAYFATGDVLVVRHHANTEI